jgi:hypothetical protein
MRSVPRLYNEDKLLLQVSLEMTEESELWVAASLQAHEPASEVKTATKNTYVFVWQW